MAREQLKELIKTVVAKSITDFSERKLIADKKSFQILDLVMPKERKIRSVVGGLETAMGRTLWEPLAKVVASNNGFEVVEDKLMAPHIMPQGLGNILSVIINSRIDNELLYTASLSHSEIKRVCDTFIRNPINDFKKAPNGTGVDVWLRKNNINYFFDTKTVQPNVADYKKFLSQILHWYGYFYSRFPTENAQARIVFPYNPYSQDFWKKTKGGGKPLEPNVEALVEDEFWDFISGEKNTFDLIKECFTDIYIEGSLQTQLDKIFERHKDDSFKNN